jgi:AcrR family transcriptional regulator
VASGPGRGLAGLSLRELAGEVGMRPQSLYSYFDSKNAIYDAMYAQGCRQFADGSGGLGASPATCGRTSRRSGLLRRFCTEDPVRYQLMFQRTIPGFEPSPESFAISEESLGEVAHLARSGSTTPGHRPVHRDRHRAHRPADLQRPGGDRWVRLLDDAIDMYVDHVTKRSGATTDEGEGSL